MSKIVISAEPDDLKTYLQKIWNHKSLIITLAKRDLKVKYAQTVLGLAWTVVQPITSVIVYTLFFSVLLNFETQAIPSANILRFFYSIMREPLFLL